MADPRLNIPTDKTDATGWMDWHKSLSSYMPIEDANTVWQTYYKQYAKFYTDDAKLRSYMKTQGVDISGILDKVQDTTVGVLGTMSSILKIGGFVTLAVGGIALFAILLAIVKIARKPIESANAASQFTPAGQGAKMVGGK